MLLTAPVKRVGNSLAIFIPAESARQANIREGDIVMADVTLDVLEPLGLWHRLGLTPISSSRRDDEMTRDRS